MNLFELFVKIGVDDQASDKLSGLSSKLGNGLKTAAKIGTAAVGAAAAGITALTTAAVNNYAEYEQLVGGVETLFGKSADTVMKYAESAYKTAGLSANEYMATVTSFSASLLQSVGGDTEKAADYANRALTDMSDNANKMGTSMELIQNAYNGFAKANYTMLDNLKLGYGGTKEEMARLIEEAAAMTDVQKELGIAVDATDMSFGNIVNAISVVQKNMKITGTTALEAGRTISGSVGAMKSAWKNLVTGFADGSADIGGLIDNLVTTIVGDGTESNLGVIGNVLPAIETALGGIAKLIEGAAPKIIEILPGLVERVVPSVISAATGMVNSVIAVLPDLLNTVVDALIQNAPALITAAIGLVQSLIQGIQDNYQILVDGAIQIVTQLATGILNMLPQIVALGLDLIVSLANGIAESLPELIPTIIDVVLQIVDTITDPSTLSNLLEAALAVIIALADGLIDSLPNLLEQAPIIVQNLVDAIIENAPKLLDSAYEIIVKLVEGIIENLPQILESGTEIVFSIIEGIAQTLGDLIIKGNEIVDSVKDGFDEKVEDAKTWGKDLISNFISGLKQKWENLKRTVSDIAQSIKDRLGFSEPKLGPLSNFHTYAPDMMDLFAKGIRDNENVITDQIEKSFDFGERTMKFGAEYDDGFGIKKSRGTAYGGTSIGNITITIDGAKYSDENALADAIAERLQMMTDRRSAVYA